MINLIEEEETVCSAANLICHNIIRTGCENAHSLQMMLIKKGRSK